MGVVSAGDGLFDFAKESGQTSWHVVGTSKMGDDDMAKSTRPRRITAGETTQAEPRFRPRSARPPSLR